MQYKVDIYADGNLLSSDNWYGYSIQDVKFWVELAIRDILENTSYQNVSYFINEN